MSVSQNDMSFKTNQVTCENSVTTEGLIYTDIFTLSIEIWVLMKVFGQKQKIIDDTFFLLVTVFTLHTSLTLKKYNHEESQSSYGIPELFCIKCPPKSSLIIPSLSIMMAIMTYLFISFSGPDAVSIPSYRLSHSQKNPKR